MTIAAFSTANDITAEAYIVLGLATCFVKQEGKLQPVQLIEPIPSAALEAIIKGIPTSYEMAIATTVGAVVEGDELKVPPEFPAVTQFCDEFADRAIATARSYATRPVAQTHIPLGSVRKDFNYSTERKRVLNSERIVSTDDNVKQHAYTHQVL
ncbi:MAG: hypothetical protein KME35_00030 [Aphanocapsa sp. GSE-SYN-MK-11-07L]|jgi:hypothetical protein|nr:hypothetical protein [Aphanocapsa sp. GSE-SYN-MK-11-07L]